MEEFEDQEHGEVVVMQSVKEHLKFIDNKALFSLLNFYSLEVKGVSEELRWRADNGLLSNDNKSS